MEQYHARLAFVLEETIRIRGERRLEAADMIGVSRNTFSAWLNGHTKISAYGLHRLASDLGIPDDLLTRPPDEAEIRRRLRRELPE